MKKSVYLIITMLFLVLSVGTYAQGGIHKGMCRLSGSLSFSKYDYDAGGFKDKSTQIQFTPAYSYLITDNLEIGGLLTLEYFEDEMSSDDYTSKFIDRQFMIGVSSRYYTNVGSFYPFAGASFSYGIFNFDGDNNYVRQLTLMLGADYFVSEAVAVEPFISYYINDTNNYDANRFMIGAGINYFIIR